MIREHIEWFNRVLTTAMQLYFRQGCEYSSLEEVYPPSDDWMERMTEQHDIRFEERVVVI